jgi:hypothetical protein
MPITARRNFDSSIKWARPPGCLHCGSNVSDLGKAVGTQCVDLGVDDPFLGRFGLCYDCAVQVALAIGFTSQASVDQAIAEINQAFVASEAKAEQAAADAAQARLDKDTVERLLGSVYSAEVQVS